MTVVGVYSNFGTQENNCCCSIVQSCLNIWTHGLQHARPLGPSPTSGVYLNSCPSSQWCHPTNHLILCRPLFLQPWIFPSIRFFSNESVLRIRWPKYWPKITPRWLLIVKGKGAFRVAISGNNCHNQGIKLHITHAEMSWCWAEWSA